MNELKRLEILKIYADLYDIWKSKDGCIEEFIKERGTEFYIRKLNLYYEFKRVYKQKKKKLKLKGLLK